MVLWAGPPASADVASEFEMVELVKEVRREAGLSELQIYWDLVDDAQSHAAAMAAAGAIFHMDGLGGVLTSGWFALAENVGTATSVEKVLEAFLGSSAHRANILGDFSYIGVGTAWSGANVYVDVIFMRGPAGLVDPALLGR